MIDGVVMNVKILVATHKKYRMPTDEMYIPIHVGAQGKKDPTGNTLDLGYVKDNTGDNISQLNPSFCELTGLYWAWKNLKADYFGLVHYRRHFALKKSTDNSFDNILTYSELEPMLGRYKIFVPKRRKYFIETLYNHYKHTHYAEQLDETEKIIAEKYPEYLQSYKKTVQRTSGYMFNMMIMEKLLFDEYCTWLFDILFELKKRINSDGLSAFQGRFYGRVSEIIFNVWLNYQLESGKINKNDIKELPYIHMEKINWIKKGTAFLSAKFFDRKYEGSF